MSDYGFVCLGMKAYAPIWDELQKAFTGEDVEVLNIGDEVVVKVIKIDDKGRVNLTIKGVTEEDKAKLEA